MKSIVLGIKKLKLGHGLTFLGCLLAGSAFFLPIINPDLFWHLSAGRYIIDSLALPRVDFLSWSMGGKEWFDFEWLVQIFYYALYKNFGFIALYSLKVLILSASLYSFYGIIKLYRLQKFAFIALPLVAAGLIPNSDLRPENFTILFFILLVFALEKTRLGIVDIKKPAVFIKLFIFFVIWVNFHAGYVYGIVLIFFYWFGELFEESLPWIYGKEKRVKIFKSKYYLAAFAVAFSASFINPYGYKIFSVMANHQKYFPVLQEYIKEWQPFDLSHIYQWPFISIFVLSFVVILFRFIKSRDIPYSHIIGMLFFAYSSSNHSRHSLFLVIVGAAWTLSAFSNLDFSGIKSRSKWFFSIFSMSVLFFYYYSFVWPQYRGAVDLKNSSDASAAFLNKNSDKLKDLKIFNSWGWGGYFGFHLYPEYKIFIDGRYIFHSFLEETQNCWMNSREWNKFVDKYGFELMILERDSSKITIKHKLKTGGHVILRRPVYLLYLPRKDWAVVHWDKKIVILAKRGSLEKKWIEKHEYKFLRPEDTGNLALMALKGELKLSQIEKDVRLYIDSNDANLKESLNDNIKKWHRNLLDACDKGGGKCEK